MLRELIVSRVAALVPWMNFRNIIVLYVLAAAFGASVLIGIGGLLKTHYSFVTPPAPTNELPVPAEPIDLPVTPTDSTDPIANMATSPPAYAASAAHDASLPRSGPAGLAGEGDEVRPAFDVARVEPSGDAVIAGRASPGATVELLLNGEVHGHVVADASGKFAMVPAPLPPGDSELTLRSKQPDGRLAMSKESVTVGLEKNRKEQPVVALMTPDKPSVVPSKPAAPEPAGGSVVVETVKTESGGKLYVSGRASPRAAVRLYLNDNSYLASTTAAANGRFAFTTINQGIKPGGGYRIRLDEVDPGSGTVRSRAEVPFDVPNPVAASDPSLNPVVKSVQGAEPPKIRAKKPDRMRHQRTSTRRLH